MFYQNYPNPFNPSTSIKLGLPEASTVSLKVYDIIGREVATLVNDQLMAGYYSYNFNARNLVTTQRNFKNVVILYEP